jgi:hypothetical protein
MPFLLPFPLLVPVAAIAAPATPVTPTVAIATAASVFLLI